MNTINVAQGTIALTRKNGNFQAILPAGRHRLNDWFNRLTVTVYELNAAPLETKLAEHLRQFHPDWVAEYCIDLCPAEDETGFLYHHDTLTEILRPSSRRLYWKNGNSLRGETRKITGIEIDQLLLARLNQRTNITGREFTLTTQIQASHLGLLKIDGEISAMLPPGDYGYWNLHHTPDITVIDTRSLLAETKLAEYLRQFHPDWVAEYCIDLSPAEDENGFLYLHDQLVEIVPPGGRRLYWKNGDSLRTEVQKTTAIAVDDTLLSRLISGKQKTKGADQVLIVQVPAWHTGVLKIDGEVDSLLAPGTYGYWCTAHKPEADVIDTRLQALDISGQEILTRDKVTLRINLSANWRYTDVLLAFSQLSQPLEHLYRELQFALREVVGTRSLDELLENKQLIDEHVMAQVAATTAPFGLEVASAGVKDIILPGEMRTILSQVVEAEKSAQANVIRRREETAATRSLLNTAKVMENNPVALRLKELETLESIAHRIDQISVYGGLDQVLNGLVNIKGTQQ